MEFVLLLVSCLLLTTRSASSSVDAVLDVEGQELRRGQAYYVLPSIILNGGGLTLTDVKKGSCPLNVTQESLRVNEGSPVMFFPQDDDVVRVRSSLYVMFPMPTPCPESTVWQLDVQAGYVTTGGYISNAMGPHFSRFAITKWEEAPGYVLQSCPCIVCRMGCFSLSVNVVDGRRVLSPSADPISWIFVRVKGEKDVIQSAVMHPKA